MIGMAKGMVTTLKNILRPAETVQYPMVKRTLPERSRTMFTIPLDEAGVPACKACMLCAKNCPDGAITIESEKRADGPGRTLVSFTVDLGLCMYCGICVENCPSSGIDFVGDYERATADKSETLVVLYSGERSAVDEGAQQPAASGEGDAE